MGGRNGDTVIGVTGKGERTVQAVEEKVEGGA